MGLKSRKPDISRTEALAARPVHAVDATLARDDGGGGKLKVALKNPRWGGWLFRMPDGATKTFELDEIGLLVWDACDGKTSVQQIIRKLAKRYNLNLREAEVSTVQFLQMLTKKGLIGMSVRKKDE
jgi:hypothetical protein